MDWITDPAIWISLVTLTVLEIVLGIDNIIFISILSGKVPVHHQRKVRQLGLSIPGRSTIRLRCESFERDKRHELRKLSRAISDFVADRARRTRSCGLTSREC